MPLESAVYISDLNASNPAASDAKSQGDDHIRLIKSAIKTTFPNINAAITGTDEALNLATLNYVPVAGVIMWAGSVASIPTGWGLCDGTVYAKLDGSGNLTSPNLTDRFIVGAKATGTYTPGATGGAVSAAITTSSSGGHSHTGNTDSAGLHGHTANTDSAGSHTHTYTDNAGAGSSTTGGGGFSFRVPTVDSTTGTTSTNGEHTHGVVVDANGTHTHGLIIDAVAAHTHTAAVATLPPYYALCFIIKL